MSWESGSMLGCPDGGHFAIRNKRSAGGPLIVNREKREDPVINVYRPTRSPMRKQLIISMTVFAILVTLSSWWLYDTTFIHDDEVHYVIHDVPAEFTNSIGMEFVYIKPGKFLMGGKTGKCKVYITNGFYLQKTEVTQGQWKRVMQYNPSHFQECGDSCPVEMVSKRHIGGFIGMLKKLEPHLIYRLPTEAEWEYSASVGDNIGLENGREIRRQMDPFAWFSWNSNKRSHPVATKAPNKNGVFDMYGNVFEWCLDTYDVLNRRDKMNPLVRRSDDSGNHVVRGGSWRAYSYYCKPAVRSKRLPDVKFSDVGFRLVLQL